MLLHMFSKTEAHKQRKTYTFIQYNATSSTSEVQKSSKLFNQAVNAQVKPYTSYMSRELDTMISWKVFLVLFSDSFLMHTNMNFVDAYNSEIRCHSSQPHVVNPPSWMVGRESMQGHLPSSLTSLTIRKSSKPRNHRELMGEGNHLFYASKRCCIIPQGTILREQWGLNNPPSASTLQLLTVSLT